MNFNFCHNFEWILKDYLNCNCFTECVQLIAYFLNYTAARFLILVKLVINVEKFIGMPLFMSFIHFFYEEKYNNGLIPYIKWQSMNSRINIIKHVIYCAEYNDEFEMNLWYSPRLFKIIYWISCTYLWLKRGNTETWTNNVSYP